MSKWVISCQSGNNFYTFLAVKVSKKLNQRNAFNWFNGSPFWLRPIVSLIMFIINSSCYLSKNWATCVFFLHQSEGRTAVSCTGFLTVMTAAEWPTLPPSVWQLNCCWGSSTPVTQTTTSAGSSHRSVCVYITCLMYYRLQSKPYNVKLLQYPPWPSVL